jgi:hypothetical protein
VAASNLGADLAITRVAPPLLQVMEGSDFALVCVARASGVQPVVTWLKDAVAVRSCCETGSDVSNDLAPLWSIGAKLSNIVHSQW